MAFTLLNFQFARGIDSTYAQGQGVTSITHTYKSDVDSSVTILTPGYFPAFIDGTPDKIFVNDTILIIATDQVVMSQVLTVNPLTLSASVFSPSTFSATFSTTFNDENNLHVTPPIPFTVSKTGNIVTMAVNGVIDIGNTVATPAAFYVSLTTLPAPLIPAFLGDGYFKIIQNGILNLGEIQVSPLGTITIYANPDHTTVFNVSVPTSFGSGSINYITA